MVEFVAVGLEFVPNSQAVADAEGFAYEPVRGPKRKVAFEPRSDGGFERVDAVWTGWQVTGREVVTTMRRI